MFRYRPNVDQTDVNASFLPELSPRLQLVHDLVPPDGNHCDVATGHGKLLIELALTSSIRSLRGTDRATAEITEAKKSIDLNGLASRIELEQSDVLPDVGESPNDRPWSLSITGLGGRSLAMLLCEDPLKTKKFERLILQPNRDEDLVRAAVHTCGYAPTSEHLVHDRGYGYIVLDCAPIGYGRPPLTTAEFVCGRATPADNPELRSAYFAWRIEYYEQRLRGARIGRDWRTVEASYRSLRLLRVARDQS